MKYSSKTIAYAIILMIVCPVVMAATFSGRVENNKGEPLPGVSVVTDLTSVGGMTDSEGRFNLSTADTITRFTFSSVGYLAVQYSVEQLPDVIVLEDLYYQGSDIVVSASRAAPGVSPIAYENFSAADIERDYTVGELPLLIGSTPNLYSFSDGGGSLGYSYVKIRGFDDKRVATYINGVPLNDPEDQATYFVDLPDFAANISDIQIQRGVGNSLYGDASFGGSINIETRGLNRPRKTTITSGYGEFLSDGSSIGRTYKQSIDYSSGLVDGRYAFSGRFSKQKSDGYRDGSWYSGWAYYFSLARLDQNMTTELDLYGGPMEMHLSYYGIPRDTWESDATYNPLTYDNETDNFNQPHYQLRNVARLNSNTTLSNTLYYIRGKGYYEQFKDDRGYSEYNITPAQINIDDSTGLPFTSGNLVRQQWVEKNQFGWNPRLDIEHDKGQHSIGGSFYFFESDHFGQVVWAANLTGDLDPTHKYYQYYGDKYVGSFYAQEFLKINTKLNLQATAQFRYQKYNFDQVRMGAFAGHDYELDWFFFSPRIGITYQVADKTNLFASVAVSSRTPTDASIYDANDPNILPSLEIKDVTLGTGGDTLGYQFGDPTAKSERVIDFEIGGEYKTNKIMAGVNLFWMDFSDEIIPFGGINENTGLPITTNADRSVHAGVEFNGSVQAHESVILSSNFSYNYNRVKDFVTTIDGYSYDFNDKKVAGFPDYLGNFMVDVNKSRLRFTYRLKFVGKQYMELVNLDEYAIDAYTVSSMSASFTLGELPEFGSMTIQLRVDNIFDEKYLSSGYGGNFAYDNGGQPVFGGWAEYYPAAERSFYAQLRMELF